MSKITLDVEEKNLKTVLSILENLKDGLIRDISTNRQYKAIKPVSSSIDKTSNRVAPSNKYLSKEEFKKRLKGN